jgi:hypothetical protein
MVHFERGTSLGRPFVFARVVLVHRASAPAPYEVEFSFYGRHGVFVAVGRMAQRFYGPPYLRFAPRAQQSEQSEYRKEVVFHGKEEDKGVAR